MATRVLEQPPAEPSGSFQSTIAELARFSRAGQSDITFQSGSDIVTQDGSAPFCLLAAGWALRYVRCRATRHAIDVLLPGDLIGLPAKAGQCPVHPVRCLTDALIVPLDGDAFARRLQAEPELLTDFLRARAAEEYRTQARITVLARLRPTARLCHLVLDLRQRLSCRGGATPLPFPLTYRQLASLIGASRSQVAASLAELRDRGWASLRSGCLFIDDAEKMVAACEFEEFLPGAWGTEVAPGPGRENAGMAGPFLLA